MTLAAPAPPVGTADRAWVRRAPLLRALLRPLAIYAASRLLVLTAAAAGALIAATAGRDPWSGPWPLVRATGVGALDGLLRWDSAWYLDVAENGYSTEPRGEAGARNAFFPLLPALVRAVAALPGVSFTAAGLLIAATAGATATMAVWLLTRRLVDEDTADRAAALFAFFPGAFTLSMVYSEGLFITFAAACLLQLDRRRWLWAGVWCALATSTRPTGFALVAACMWAAGWAVWRGRDWRALVAPVLAPLGALSFFGYLWWRTSEPFAWFVAQRDAWSERVDLLVPFQRVGRLLTEPAATVRELNALLPLLGMLVALAALALLVRWRPPGPVTVYATLALLLALFSVTIGTRPRMALAAFPLIMALAVGVPRRAFPVLLALSAGSCALLTVLTIATIAATP